MALSQAAIRRRVLPGFPLTLGVTITYLGLLVLLPLAALVTNSLNEGLGAWWEIISRPRVLSALRVSFGTAALAAIIDAGLGLLIAWVLVRYPFPGRRIVDALVDLPFALPTAVAGIALTTLYAPNGWIGRWLEPLGIKVAFTPLGILVALVFVGLPFVVRSLQPVLQQLNPEFEEASVSLGATRWQTVRRVILPPLVPVILTGTTLAFARGVGEYGSVIFIAGNMPGISEIAPLLIVVQLEQYDYLGAAAIGTAMLIVSLAVLVALNSLERWSHRGHR